MAPIIDPRKTELKLKLEHAIPRITRAPLVSLYPSRRNKKELSHLITTSSITPRHISSTHSEYNKFSQKGGVIKPHRSLKFSKLKQIILKDHDAFVDSFTRNMNPPASESVANNYSYSPQKENIRKNVRHLDPKIIEVDDSIQSNYSPVLENSNISVCSPKEKETQVGSVNSETLNSSIGFYVKALPTEEFDKLTKELLMTLHRFQERCRAENPYKFKTNIRFVLGLRNCARLIRREKLILVILATDMTPSPSEGGLDDTIRDLISTAEGKNIPWYVALSRRQLRVIGNGMRQSVVGVVSVRGAESIYTKMKAALPNPLTGCPTSE